MEKNLQQQPSNCFKVVLYGPESSGKTTLAASLAKHFGVSWVPEFARDYLQNKWDLEKKTCEPSDLIPIAIGQMKLENQAALANDSLLFLDTNLLTTKVYSEVYYGYCEESLKIATQQNTYDLYLLTQIDVPWEADDLRDKPNEREAMFHAFENELIRLNLPYIVISGNIEKRIEIATHVIENCLKLKSLGFQSSDFVQIINRNITAESIESQLDFFKNGIQKATLMRPAILNDGILSISLQEAKYFQTLFDENKNNLKVNKFVPASGAATRMFKFLTQFVNEFSQKNDTLNHYINKNKARELQVFMAGLEKFPFYESVLQQTQKLYQESIFLNKEQLFFYFIKTMLTNPEFNYVNLPKGVLPFHTKNKIMITPLEEHLNEALDYADSNHRIHVHFTISKEHQSHFENIIQEIVPALEAKHSVYFQIKFSYQNPQTDTLAVTLDKKPYRLKEGTLFFRPGGHGALIENLNNLNADFVFIKNIDNVSQNHREIQSLYKKALGGILYTIQTKVFKYLHQLDTEINSKEDLEEIIDYTEKKLNIKLIPEFQFFTKEYKINHLKKLLNRPIRVCGMVKNESEPGGGPFWVKDEQGTISLQIIESSQIDFGLKEQAKIYKRALFFNPVDMVCGIRNFKGSNFDLRDFVDSKSGLIVEKNLGGDTILCYELPGLWNGAMADWITVFVEVPIETFNPVKTVNDLLKPNHQP